MKESLYNIYIKKDDALFIFNTLSGNILKISDKNIINSLNDYLKGKDTLTEHNKKFLLTNNFFVNDDVNEIECVHSFIKEQKILTITIFLTTKCNFRCLYCYEAHENTSLNSTSYHLLLNFIKKEIQKEKFINLRINFFGGEPLLEYNNLLSFLKELTDILRKFEITLSFGITTNGYLLTKERYLDLIQYGLNDLQITIDGFEEEHDKKRFLINGEGTWSQIMKNLDEITKIGKKEDIIIRTNFDKNSLNSEKDFILYCKRRFNNNFIMHFQAIKKWGSCCDIAYLDENAEDLQILELVKFCKNNNVDTLFNNILDIGFYACVHCLKNSYVFDVNLNLLKCTVELKMPENYIGKLNNNSQISYSDNQALWDIDKSLCSNCALYPQCLGIKCPAQSIKNANFQCNKPKELDYYKKLLLTLID